MFKVSLNVLSFFFIINSGDSRILELGHLRPCSPTRVTRKSGKDS